MGYRKGYYRKDGTYVQGHYANNRSKSFSRKNSNGCSVLLIVMLALGSIMSCSESSETSIDSSNTSSGSSSNNSSSSNCPTKTCGDFTSQAQAQATYNSNRTCYKNLDSDGDGKACETLK